MEYVNCNICGKNDAELLFEGKDLKFELPGRFNVVKCRNCGLIYTNPRPTKQEILMYYPTDYKLHQIIPPRRNPLLKSIGHAYDYLLLGNLYGLDDLPRGKILDVGCGSGIFLRQLKEKGWQTYGVEISPIAARRAQTLGLEVFTGELHQAKFSINYFDVILMKHVLEHLNDPLRTLEEARRILKDEGVLIISVPNVQSVEARVFGKYWEGFELPRHLYHFSPYTLRLLLKKSRFRIIKITNEAGNIWAISLNYLTARKIEKFFEHPIIQALSLFLTSVTAKLGIGGLVVHAKK